MNELDEQGQKSLQIVQTDITIKPKIGEDRFKPVIPEGVTLEDKTK